MTSGPRRVEGSLKSAAGGTHVATVKVSTSLRTKKRGKVPPRLETLRRKRVLVGAGLRRVFVWTYVARSVM